MPDRRLKSTLAECHRCPTKWLLRGVFFFYIICSATLSWGQAFDEIGLTALREQLGENTPDGSGISVSQVEAQTADLEFIPDPANPQFAGKSLNVIGSSVGVSGHATRVASNLYGLTSGVASGITDINLYETNLFLGPQLLNTTGLEPLVETQDIQNHSWVGTFDNETIDQQSNRRLDFLINRDDVVSVVAVNNGAQTRIPPLLANSFNSIVTGLSSGAHSTGTTFLEEPVRQAPHIVAPESATSFSNPYVAGGAALLLQTARADSELELAGRNEAIRAILLAGATKDEFPEWSNSVESPLDGQFGAGELHIQRSHNILTAGRQEPGSADLVDTWGWDLQTEATGQNTYFFDVPEGGELTEFSALLTWNRTVVDANPFNGFTPSGIPLNDLDLQLYNTDGGFDLYPLVAESDSTGNTEHIYFNEDLGLGNRLEAGRYALVVNAGDNPQDYALAWFRNQPDFTCDFDGDGRCDLSDLEALYENIGTTEAAFDVNGDGTVTAADISGWLDGASITSNPFNENGLTFEQGDVNFDGRVDSSDLGQVLNNFGETDSGLLYTDGDLNADGTIDSSDLGLVLNEFGFRSALPTAASQTVPEPEFNLLLLVIGLIAVARLRRSSRAGS